MSTCILRPPTRHGRVGCNSSMHHGTHALFLLSTQELNDEGRYKDVTTSSNFLVQERIGPGIQHACAGVTS